MPSIQNLPRSASYSLWVQLMKRMEEYCFMQLSAGQLCCPHVPWRTRLLSKPRHMALRSIIDCH
jgi:hypothetical protein